MCILSGSVLEAGVKKNPCFLLIAIAETFPVPERGKVGTTHEDENQLQF